MARKSGLNIPPAVSSSDEDDDDVEEEEEEAAHRSSARNQNDAGESEEEDSDDSDDEDEEDEDEEEEPDPKKGKSPPPKDSRPTAKDSTPSRSGKPNPQDDSDGSETESDSGPVPPSPSVSDFTIKPAAKKPANASLKPKKLPMETEKPPVKRSADNSNHGDDKDSKSKAKKAKTSTLTNENGGGEEGAVGTEKKGMINRLWSDDDEIAILKGMIDFQSEKGTDPNADPNAFHEYMKNYDISVDGTRNQLMDKIRRMKKKYRTYVSKAENGEDPVILKPHDNKCFQLSKKVWGGENAGKSRRSKAKLPGTPNNKSNEKNSSRKKTEEKVSVQPSSNPKEEALVEKPEVRTTSKRSFSELYPLLSGTLKLSSESSSSLISDDGIKYFEQKATFIGESKLNELEEKCKKQKLAETEVFIRRTELMRELAQNMLEVMKP